MYFELVDGKPRFAKGKIIVAEQVETPEGLKELQREVYLFADEEMAEHPDAEPIEQPTAEMLAKAKSLEGKTLSRSEFEKLLLEPVPNDMEQRVSDLEVAIAAILGGGS